MKTEIKPLPLEWVDRIFSKLTARYGRDFLSQWEGVEIGLVKADWAEELSGLQSRPDAIKHALEHCGVKPPKNVIEFKEACNRAPVRPLLAIAAPVANPDVIERAIAAARELTKFKGDRLDPIRRLRERELEGDKRLTRFQREFWRIVLKHEMEKQA